MSKQQRVLYNKQEDSIRICVWYYASTESIATYWYYTNSSEQYKRAKELNPNHNKDGYKRKLELHPNLGKEHYQRTLELHPNYYNKKYLVNKEKLNKRCREYYWANKEKLNKNNCEYYWANKEKMNKDSREYYWANKEKMNKDSREYYKNHGEEYKKRDKVLRKKNIENKRFPVTCIVCGKVHYVGKRSSQLKTKYCKSCGLTGKNIEYKGMHFMSEEECGVYKYLNTKYNIILCQVKNTLNKKHIDFYIRDLNLFIEYHPEYWCKRWGTTLEQYTQQRKALIPHTAYPDASLKVFTSIKKLKQKI